MAAYSSALPWMARWAMLAPIALSRSESSYLVSCASQTLYNHHMYPLYPHPVSDNKILYTLTQFQTTKSYIPSSSFRKQNPICPHPVSDNKILYTLTQFQTTKSYIPSSSFRKQNPICPHPVSDNKILYTLIQFQTTKSYIPSSSFRRRNYLEVGLCIWSSSSGEVTAQYNNTASHRVLLYGSAISPHWSLYCSLSGYPPVITEPYIYRG